MDPCLAIDPCLNGATCADLGTGEYFCSCPIGFEGNRCETGRTFTHNDMLRNRFGRQCSRSNPLQKDHVFNAHFGSFVSLFMIWRVFISAKCMNISWNPIVSMWTLTLVCMRFSVYNGDCNFLIRVQYGLKLFELKYLCYHKANACGREKKAFLSNFYVILSFAASSNGLQICW